MKIIGLTVVCMMLSATIVAAQGAQPALLVERFTAAWDKSDPVALGDLFLPEADLIAPDGVTARGRAAIAAYYTAAFARGYAGSTGEAHVFQQRMITPNLVLLDASFSIFGARKTHGSLKPEEKGAMVAMLCHTSVGWRIVALRERAGSDFILLPATR